jgi:hypothetical protein
MTYLALAVSCEALALLDFLITESQSGSLSVPPSFHLSSYCFAARTPRYWDLCDRHWESFVPAYDFFTEIESF